MNAPSPVLISAANHNERMSTRIAFLIAGLLMSAWAPLVPLVKARAGLDDGGLGLLLLGLGGGSIAAMPFAGYLTAHYGCRPVVIWATIVLCAVLPLLSTMEWLPGLVIAVIIFGASMGMLDCAMNIQSVIVEKNSGQTLQSGFHGLYSVGGIVGAGAMTALLTFGLDPLIAALCIVTTVLGSLYKAAPTLLTYGTERGGPLFAVPRGIVLLLGTLCFIVFLTEGAMLDWSAVFLVSNRGLEPSIAGLGYASFAAAMTVGRLTGDAIVSKLGGVRVVVLGGLCAAAGMIVSLGIDGWPASLIGYALVGAGCSNIVPVIFTAVGRQQRMPQAVAIPAVISMGYAGILIGPVFIGAVAHLSTLSFALGCLIVLLFFVSAAARSLRN
ncbi:Inner membrane protein YbjJ [compost metagenome]|jgi:MFS family permease|uniref:MFS transporter n=1 Tax=Pseudomonas TaxID=286 RepID=UPI000F920711|nr:MULTISPECIES: MFS transporter [Pseudomonas]MBV7525488.1 MFS transporter [Pseudomonas sp. PDM29]VVM85144.1 Inner membrane protein YbjJ [Pseudomonas fluorescens]VVO57503.1 Inner membrane protein YbjJ [Pseudomonas fluorescens]